MTFDRERVGDWALDRIPQVTSWGPWYQAIGLERGGELVAAFVYNLHSEADIAMHVAAIGKRWASRWFLRTAFAYPFLQLKVRRVSAYVPAKNKASRQFAEKVGCCYEGTMRHALPDDDVIVYGMLREECRWL